MRRGRGPQSDPRPDHRLSDKRQPISKASDAQREKVAEYGRCVSCGYTAPFVHLDPHHLVPVKWTNGCPDPRCCIALCRGCHSLWHDHKLDLWSILVAAAAGGEFHDELQHACEHLNWELVTLLQLLARDEIVWKSTLERPGA